MALTDLIVNTNATVTLDARAPEYAGNITRVSIQTLDDLQKSGLFAPGTDARHLLDAAHTVTLDAMRAARDKLGGAPSDQHVSSLAKSGAINLGRYSAFRKATSTVSGPDAHAFWQLVRKGTSPAELPTAMTDKLAWQASITVMRLQDLIVAGKLFVKSNVKVLHARDVVIKKGGQINVLGATLKIQATSIVGAR
jgi:hypothetical protein